jgi:hypothetical protein
MALKCARQHQHINLLQAYVQYVTGKVTILGGKFLTLAGEGGGADGQRQRHPLAPIWYANPPLTSACRLRRDPRPPRSPLASTMAGTNDGSVPNGGKTAELAAEPNPSKTFALRPRPTTVLLTGSGLVGNRADRRGRHLDRNARTNRFLNADWDPAGSCQRTRNPLGSWYGVAGYLNYAINQTWRTSLRLEYLDDKDGYLWLQHNG